MLFRSPRAEPEAQETHVENALGVVHQGAGGDTDTNGCGHGANPSGGPGRPGTTVPTSRVPDGGSDYSAAVRCESCDPEHRPGNGRPGPAVEE